MIQRVAIGGCALLVGLVFVATFQFLPVRMCAESCPDWLSLFAMGYYVLVPLLWLAAGLLVGRPAMPRNTRLRIITGLTLASLCVGAFLVGYANYVARTGAVEAEVPLEMRCA